MSEEDQRYTFLLQFKVYRYLKPEKFLVDILASSISTSFQTTNVT